MPRKVSLSRISRMNTFSRRGLETSMPTTGLPGMGARILTESARSAMERSSARVTIRFTFTPGAGSNSKVVITGPGWTATTFPSTGFSFAVSGMKMPPLVFSSSSTRLTTTRSCNGLIFILLISSSCKN